MEAPSFAVKYQGQGLDKLALLGVELEDIAQEAATLTSTCCPTTADTVSDTSEGPATPESLRSLGSIKGANREKLRTDVKAEDHAYKVFVGGIPRNMDQAALVDVFVRMDVKVRKAWLQKPRKLQPGQKGLSRPSFHRGFGFVIFQDRYSMWRVLGSEQSRFLDLPGGVRLEVKRAMASSEVKRAVGPADLRGGRQYDRKQDMSGVEKGPSPDLDAWKASVALGLRMGLTVPAAVAAATRAPLPPRGPPGLLPPHRGGESTEDRCAQPGNCQASAPLQPGGVRAQSRSSMIWL